MTGPDDEAENGEQPPAVETEEKPIEVAVPFLDAPVGIGDVIAKITSAVGIKSCRGCKDRQGRANKKLRFVPRRKHLR